MSTWSLDKPAAGDVQKQRPLSSYNTRPKNHGEPKYFSGKESSDNNIIKPVTSYYEDRHPQIRKSIAYSPPRRDGFPFKETPGQSSENFPLHNHNKIYNAFV